MLLKLKTAISAFVGVFRGKSMVFNCTFVNTTLTSDMDGKYTFRGYDPPPSITIDMSAYNDDINMGTFDDELD